MTSLLADDRLLEMTEEPSSVPMRAPAGVAKTFREDDPTQSFRLPPSLDDWLPQDHRSSSLARWRTHCSISPLSTTATWRSRARHTATPR
jgi:hypothetical protein